MLESFTEVKELEVAHNDGNGLNNRLDNLRWDTHKNNMQDMFMHDTNNKGSRNGRHKLNECDVIKIKSLLNDSSDLEISNQFRVSKATINLIRNNKTWKHIG